MIVKIPSSFIIYSANKTKYKTWKLLGSFSDAECFWISTCNYYTIYKMDTPSFLCKQHQIPVCFWKKISDMLFVCYATLPDFCPWKYPFLLAFHYHNFRVGQWIYMFQQHMILSFSLQCAQVASTHQFLVRIYFLH